MPSESPPSRPGAVPGLPAGALAAYLCPLLQQRGMVLDVAQVAALARLQRLFDELLAFKAARRSPLRRLIERPQPPRGIYFWGGVGRGKSFLMDAFHHSLPYRRKTRVHFHAFMRGVHRELAGLKREVDPLKAVAERIARRYRVVCFDEFHVSDIADAMILGRLFAALLERGVVFVATSNYRPEDLYPNGLQRENFLPTIALIRRELDVLEVDGGTDYRLRAMERFQSYRQPCDEAAMLALERLFEEMREGEDESRELEVEGRRLHARRRAGGMVWFDFSTLCEGPRSQVDYLELAQRFHTLVLSGLRRMGADERDVARRFTWLVDVLYDHRVKLFVAADAPAETLYTQGSFANEFARTVSRLTEMQTRDYLAAAHLAA
ncbi:Cell division protein ZapE [Burkholderiales bacterium]|nr:Cell division protein ZapE [Burkholderiales bacterium]